MKRLKEISLNLPEYLLVAAVIFYWASSGMIINPIAIGLITVLMLQIIFKNRIVGVLIPGLLIMTGLYMLMALMSEFNEFPTFNSDAKKLLFVGLSYFVSTIAISGIMLYKYIAIEPKNDHQPVSPN
jgi:hypothetical protein